VVGSADDATQTPAEAARRQSALRYTRQVNMVCQFMCVVDREGETVIAAKQVPTAGLNDSGFLQQIDDGLATSMKRRPH
jgi:hypothetical protein